MVRMLLAALALSLGATGAWADRYSDCNSKDPERKIRGCTEIINRGSQENRKIRAIAYNSRGYAYFNKGEYDAAIADYTKAIELDPKDAIAYNNRGYAYLDKGEYDAAIADYTKAITINPKYALGYGNRCAAYNQKGKYDQAIADCTQAIKITPNNPIAYKNRGNAYYNKGEYDLAIADFTKAIDINPKYFNVLGGLSHTLLFVRDFAKALESADEAIALAPDEIWLHTNRAHALMFLGRVDEARALYLKHRGAKNVGGKGSWETVILDDFAELRKAGLTSPLMDEIEKKFTAG